MLKRHDGKESDGKMSFHGLNGLHASTFPVYSAFKSNMSGKTKGINVIIDSKVKKEVEGGVGNFVELLNFRVRAGDKVLEDHLNSCGRNQTYISKTSQNKLIKCCGEVITDKIISDLKASRFYSVIADEARDISNTEQMSLVLRFIDQNMDIREEFVGFLPCKWGLKGEQLAKVVLDALGNLGLSIADCRGQGYDGAGAVAGHINGMAAHLRRLNDKALFTHCYSHRLNLAISGRKKKLIDVCRTRWVERIDGLDTFQQLLIPVFKTLREMKKNVDKDHSLNVSSDASELLDLLEKFDFVVALVICRNVFDSTIGVTQLLQGKSIDIMDGLHLITSLKTFVVNVRNSIDKYHDTWYEESLALARELDIDEAKPRTVGRQTTRANVPYKTTSEYYKRIFSIPLVDHLNSALKARFNTDSVNVYNGLSIVPYKMISLLNNGMNWKEKFKVVSNFYHDDLPNPLALDSEILLWETYWVDYEGTIPDSISATLKALKFEGFENIKIILRILGTLTITSCECERSFSVLRELKNYKRSTMVSERLNGLAMMRVHQEIVPETSEVIDRFAMDNTRLKFV
ncbi:52 kDa repressor of the inhibitor of the protein kinase-like [Xenia sp. Carnegie-2017]|uniref:52 kDa repressor of the inhibitor of the protein kinase-like n=1 Tax=Xenia sp. Carnegie-2017 TaxID=2897299 RepID=UPI001F039A8B|nr:52 kDa repressor of the inhibitor of the protein kinase-like [Xenia sp. Carnegie-2017]